MYSASKDESGTPGGADIFGSTYQRGELATPLYLLTPRTFEGWLKGY